MKLTPLKIVSLKLLLMEWRGTLRRHCTSFWVLKKLSVCSIFGLTVSGKTTLVKFLYNNSVVEEHWQFRTFVDASSNFDVHNLSCEIFNIVGGLMQFFDGNLLKHLGITSNTETEVDGSQYTTDELQRFIKKNVGRQKVFHCLG